MNADRLHCNWHHVKHYRADKLTGKSPVIPMMEGLNDVFALCEQLAANQGTTLDNYLIQHLGPKPDYLPCN